MVLATFSDLRVQWNTVSVVDPIATIPFGIFLIVLSRFSRENRLRTWLNMAGLAWFCGYICLYTVWHKMQVNTLFKEKLSEQRIDYQRIYTNPSIFNNIVWYGLAEGDTAYYFGMYGFNDPVKKFGRISTVTEKSRPAPPPVSPSAIPHPPSHPRSPSLPAISPLVLQWFPHAATAPPPPWSLRAPTGIISFPPFKK